MKNKILKDDNGMIKAEATEERPVIGNLCKVINRKVENGTNCALRASSTARE